MYNEEVKSDFIKDYMRNRVVAFTSLTGLFNKTEEHECKLKKDCSQFTKEEILNMYKNFKAKSLSVLENYNVHLKRYTAYRLHKKQINTDNSYSELTKDMIKECLDPEIQEQLYVTREELNDIENELFNYTDKAIVEALWNGISGKSMCDLVSLNEDMISPDKDSIIFPDGRIVGIDQKLVVFLEKAFRETEYICYGETLKVEKVEGQGSLYKARSNAYAQMTEDVRFRWVYRKIQNYRKYLDIPLLTMKNIQASGLLHKLQTEMKKNNCSMREVLATEKGKKLAVQYGYKPNHYIDVIIDKFNEYQEQA